MSLNEQISAEIKTSMKAGDSFATGLLRFLLAQVQGKVKEKFGAAGGLLTDEEILEIFKKEAKKRREAITLYEQGGRQDLADNEKKELVFIEKYLPAQLGRDEIKKIALEVREGGATEFSALMKGTMAKTGGRADGKLVSEVVKEILG